ncbi:hypothetical protein An02g05417 [Aspergillus niger]|uniref:Uncharacterized protein n=2 Tax=Aspergillus niger TaxID=5061 RepID=A2QD08_ASPNC|nr:hypothetical protein An02g05417 [Aspergillus niger]CAK47670.1 hypothetical protein An02g05417 [Aspergillus niger]
MNRGREGKMVRLRRSPSGPFPRLSCLYFFLTVGFSPSRDFWIVFLPRADLALFYSFFSTYFPGYCPQETILLCASPSSSKLVLHLHSAPSVPLYILRGSIHLLLPSSSLLIILANLFFSLPPPSILLLLPTFYHSSSPAQFPS